MQPAADVNKSINSNLSPVLCEFVHRCVLYIQIAHDRCINKCRNNNNNNNGLCELRRTLIIQPNQCPYRGWLLDSRVVSVLDSGAGNSFEQTAHTHCASVHQAAKLVAALLRVAEITLF